MVEYNNQNHCNYNLKGKIYKDQHVQAQQQGRVFEKQVASLE
jgi:hypothetical protein